MLKISVIMTLKIDDLSLQGTMSQYEIYPGVWLILVSFEVPHYFLSNLLILLHPNLQNSFNHLSIPCCLDLHVDRCSNLSRSGLVDITRIATKDIELCYEEHILKQKRLYSQR